MHIRRRSGGLGGYSLGDVSLGCIRTSAAVVTAAAVVITAPAQGAVRRPMPITAAACAGFTGAAGTGVVGIIAAAPVSAIGKGRGDAAQGAIAAIAARITATGRIADPRIASAAVIAAVGTIAFITSITCHRKFPFLGRPSRPSIHTMNPREIRFYGA